MINWTLRDVMHRAIVCAMVVASFFVTRSALAIQCNVGGECSSKVCADQGLIDLGPDLNACNSSQPYCCGPKSGSANTGNGTCDQAAKDANPGVLLSGSACVSNIASDCTGQNGKVVGSVAECGSTKTCCAFIVPTDLTTGKTGAAGANAPKSLEELDPLHKATFYQVIQNIIRAFLGFVGALALLVFIYAGITWMTAGSSDRIQKAKDSMKYAVIGLALIVFAYAITTFFLKTLAGG